MPSADPDPLDPSQRRALLALARQSIVHGLDQGCPLPVVPSDYPADLRARRATFVTLETGETLRGCIGYLEAVRRLVLDVTENAFAAAFRDPRFQPLTRPELARLSIDLLILTLSQPLSFASEEELLRMIEPVRDGLILDEGTNRGTFLPAVWESLPEPRTFLRHLKRKAGLPPGYWLDRIRVRRYRTESCSE